MGPGRQTMCDRDRLPPYQPDQLSLWDQVEDQPAIDRAFRQQRDLGHVRPAAMRAAIEEAAERGYAVGICDPPREFGGTLLIYLEGRHRIRECKVVVHDRRLPAYLGEPLVEIGGYEPLALEER